MLRHMGMDASRWMIAPLLVTLAGCTGSSHSASRPPSPAGTPSSGHSALQACAAVYSDAVDAAVGRAGDLRYIGPQMVASTTKPHFAALPDDEQVTLCLVPRRGGYLAYGVPLHAAPELLWNQGGPPSLHRPI